MKKRMLPGYAAHVPAVICTFVFTCVLVLGGVLWLVNDMLTNREMHLQTASNPQVLAAQKDYVRAKAEEIAKVNAFDPQTVMNLLTDEALQAHNAAAVAWWMVLLGEKPEMEAPAWDTRDMEQAVREDAVFQENTPSARRRTVARDDIAYEVGKAVDKAVMPVRTELMTLFMPKVLEKVNVPHYMGYLAKGGMVCLAAAAVLGVVVMLLMFRRLSKGLMYMGAGLAAAGLVALALGAVAALAGLPAMVGEISPIFGLQLQLTMRSLTVKGGIAAAACLLVGLGLIGLHQADMKRFLKGQRGADA